MDLYEVMRVTGTVRRFKGGRVPHEVLHRVLDNARFAPSGGNRQGWRVIVVEDFALRRRLRDLYLVPWRKYIKERGYSERANHMAEHLHEAPVHLLVTVDLRALAVTDKDLPRQSIVGGGSVYPFVHNILLALRQEGLGAAFTTMLVAEEPAVKVLFGIPEEHALAALVAVGWPDEPLPKKLSRKPVEEFARLDRFDGPPLQR